MLPVVHPFAGLRIRERGGASPQHGLRFEHQDTRAAGGQCTAARRPATPAPITMTSGDRHLNGTMTFSQVNAAIIAWRGRATRDARRKTSYPARSIERSRSK